MKTLLWVGAVVAVLAVVALILSQTVFAKKEAVGVPPAADSSNKAEPFMLMIPRWFLSSLTVDGKEITLPAKQQTLQFTENGQANGEGGCNSFGAIYHAASGGSLTFEPIAATLMACEEGMDQEASYLKALSQVQHFAFDGGNLILTSEDGQTRLVFRKPPK